jgi:hypothetical protein
MFELPSKNRLTAVHNASLNPWTEHELANPYLNAKTQPFKTKEELKKLSQRKKIFSLEHPKNTKIFLTFGSK